MKHYLVDFAFQMSLAKIRFIKRCILKVSVFLLPHLEGTESVGDDGIDHRRAIVSKSTFLTERILYIYTYDFKNLFQE